MSRFELRRLMLVGAPFTVVFLLTTTAFVVLPGAGDDPAAPSSQWDETGAEGHARGPGASWSPEDGISPWGLDKMEPPRLVHEHTLPAGEGTLPSRSQAMGFDDRYSSLRARGSDGLDRLAGNGHLSGSGTPEDPYVLERFYVDGDLVVESTDQALVIREGYVTGQMKLNYVGEDLLVHHVYATDLRVNENIRRNGTDTGGLFHDNEFGFIGQLRHFSGEFRDNVVGPRPQGVVLEYLSDTGLVPIPEGLVFNFDGFHGANVHSNSIHGRVDIKLHGHYHGDCLDCAPHDHQDKAHFPPEDRDDEDASQDGGAHGHHDHGEPSHHDLAPEAKKKWLQQEGLRSHHSIRYHSLHFHSNEIQVDGSERIALRYYDRAHRGDDETAASEPNPYLEDPHVHYQYVWLEDNTLVGGRLMLDVLNAEDDRHTLDNLGVLRVEGNTIRIPVHDGLSSHSEPAHGIRLTQAEGFEMLVIDNEIIFENDENDLPLVGLLNVFLPQPERIGMIATSFDRGTVTFTGNRVVDADVGIFVNSFSASVWWFVEGNEFPEDEIRQHNTENPPNEPAPSSDGQDDGDEDEKDDDEKDDGHGGHDHHGHDHDGHGGDS